MESRIFVGVAALAGVLSAPLAAQQAVLPPLVVKDGQGDIIGPVVGFLTMSRPIVRPLDIFNDMGTPRIVPVFLAVIDGDTLRAAVGTTYYSTQDCSGTPYHKANLGDATSGLADLTGYAYSVAEYTGSIHLIRSNRFEGGTSNTPYDSVYSGETCSNNSGTDFLRPGEAALDLETEFPPDYVAQ